MQLAAPAPAPVAEVRPREAAPPRPRRHSSTATLDRPRARAAEVRRPSLAARVAQLPRVLLETVAWGGFAAVVALIVIALSDVGVGRAALWAICLSGIVVLAVGVMAVTGTHLDELNSAGRTAHRAD